MKTPDKKPHPRWREHRGDATLGTIKNKKAEQKKTKNSQIEPKRTKKNQKEPIRKQKEPIRQQKRTQMGTKKYEKELKRNKTKKYQTEPKRTQKNIGLVWSVLVCLNLSRS